MAETNKPEASELLVSRLDKKDLKFTVRAGERTKDTAVQELTYYFDLDENHLPIKVGDGTYGVVFRIYDARDVWHAVKILYNAKKTDIAQAKSDIVKKRFEYEAQALEDIRSNLRGEGNAEIDMPILQPIGWTEKFHDSDAFKTLSQHKIFEKFGLDVSQYAMVTKLYDGTLKDLLEGEAPFKGEPEHHKNFVSGYEMLSSLDFATRIKTIKPFLNKIAEGLVVLHKAKKCHLDLKPANIYFKCSPNEFDVVIGDLGFIGQPELAGTATSPDEIALGTRHYRSPEQKDFSDSCEVDVEINNSPKKGISPYRVIVNDPKFADTIIEPGDALIFSKDIKRREHIIDHIEWVEGSVQAIITFRTTKPMEVDRNTQVVIYKHQSTRTDIFGFGALLYDMITCGRSAERFYDYLRVDDLTKKGVSNIREKYRQVSTYSAQDPNYVNTFSSFRHENGQDYAPLEIVELILECMLYQAEGTLYNTFVDKNDVACATHWKAMDAAIKRLNDLESKYSSTFIKSQNPLITRIPKPTISYSTDEITDELIKLQNMELSRLPYRIGHAAIRVRQLINLVQQATINRDFFLAEMTPENIILGQDSSEKPGFSIITYNNFGEYQKDLLEDIVYTKVFYNPSNPYSHDSLGHIRRKITLTPYTEQSILDGDDIGPKKENQQNTWAYKFNNSSPFGDFINVGDWIVFKNDQLNELHQVIESSKGGIVKTKRIENNKKIKEQKNSDLHINTAVYYRNINAADYYLACLGIYLYQAFFVGLCNNSISEAAIIQRYKIRCRTSPLQLEKVHSSLRNVLNSPIYKNKSNQLKMKVDLFRHIAALYAVLSLPNPSRFFDDDSNPNIENILDNLFGYWNRIITDMEECLGLDSGFLTISENIDRLKKNNIKNLEDFCALDLDENSNLLNIDNLFKKIMKVQRKVFDFNNWIKKVILRSLD